MILVTAAEMRRLDDLTIRSHGTPGYTLMQRAGAGAARVLLERFPALRPARRGQTRVVVVAGKGNNGGDGFIVARLLRARGIRAEVLLLGAAAEVKGDAATALGAYRRARGPLHEVLAAGDVTALPARLAGAAVLVDAVFGTGLNAEVEGRHADVLRAMNDSGAPIFAVDIPSGLDADRGTPLGVAVRAAATATFGFAKIGQVLHPGIGHVGHLEVVDIGIAAPAVAAVNPRTELLEPAGVGALVPVRRPEAHKGDCGHVLVLAGSRGHSGAALLAARAACRAGAGLTTLAGPASLNAVFSGGAPEVMTALLPDEDGKVGFDAPALRRLLEGKSAVVAGPGLGTHAAAERLVRFLLAECRVPLVLDADALTCAARAPGCLRSAAAPTLLTPHPGEMARLLGADTAAVQADRVGTARAFAAAHGCVLVLKGARSLVASPDGGLAVNPTGNPGMASGGMGDALAGILGALLAQGLSPADAARLGVYAHGDAADAVAAERGMIGLLASDIIDAVPGTLQRLRCAAERPPTATPETPARNARSRRTPRQRGAD